MKIPNLIEGFAKSKVGKGFYKWACDPSKEKFINNTLPQIETVLSTACYVWSTAKQKNIDKEQRDLLQIQNIGSGVIGLGLSTIANKKVSKMGENIISQLDPNKIDPKAIKQISTGIRVGLPIVTTLSIMRLILPTLTAGVSGKIMDKVREKKKLDVKA